MSANSFGKIFQITTFGESHGDFLGCIIDGIPSNFQLDLSIIQHNLDKRRPGSNKFISQRKELDKIIVLAGLFEGKTTGSPVAIVVKNEDAKPKDYSKIKNTFRPSHADYSYYHKFKHRDYRGGGRSSARETIARVIAGSIAQQYLEQNYKIKTIAYVSQIGDIKTTKVDFKFIEQNPFFLADDTKTNKVQSLIQALKKQGDSIGAKINIIVKNIPLGLGEPVFNKLNADLAHAIMGINAVKAVEIGDGVEVVTKKGSENRDEINKAGFLSNHAGGILGGISTGQDILIKASIKPTSSIKIPSQTVDINNNTLKIITEGRHDPCIGIRAVPIAEAMVNLVIIDHLMLAKAKGYIN